VLEPYFTLQIGYGNGRQVTQVGGFDLTFPGLLGDSSGHPTLI
ncbi:uncharacterized protein METZ01_LOCUS516445, partial [marine metagenome]